MLRDDVLLLLTEAEGYLSGEEMREKLGVSRAAVSQAVRALRADGYDIDAVTNRGYCLRARPDTLTAGDVLPYLPEARRATVRCFAQIDSTNSYLKAEAMRGAPDGLCAIADRQTAGRGRAGRPFRSDAGQGVYLSMLLRPNCVPTAAMTMTAHVAVAVCRALEACGAQPGIKWTNDLVLGTKKLCGILTELTVEAETGTVDSIVAGIGVNVRQRPEDFPPELRAIAGSVRSETGLEISRARLAAEMVRALDRMYLDWQRDPRAYLDDYRARCVTVGRPVRVVRGESYEMQPVGPEVPEEANFGVRVAGDSMEPRFHSGQTVWVHQQPTLDPGEIGVFLYDGSAYLKQLRRDGGRVYLHSLNPAYADLEISDALPLRVLGKAVS